MTETRFSGSSARVICMRRGSSPASFTVTNPSASTLAAVAYVDHRRTDSRRRPRSRPVRAETPPGKTCVCGTAAEPANETSEIGPSRVIPATVRRAWTSQVPSSVGTSSAARVAVNPPGR